MTYCAHAKVVESEKVFGRYRDPTDAELAVIEDYREKYRATFGVYPGGLAPERRRARSDVTSSARWYT